MRNINSLLALSFLLLCQCSGKKHQFPLDKRYWDANDYNDAIRELKFDYAEDEKLPTFDDPETNAIVQKLTDETNFKVILDDKELGLKHKSEAAGAFFDQWRDMSTIYTATDRKDKYLYERELLAVWHFGLDLQLKYFKLGNDNMLEKMDDPNAENAKDNVNTNVHSLIDNSMIYLDLINTEDTFSENGKKLLAQGIDDYFPLLIQTYPDADYSALREKVDLMEKKTKSENIKVSLAKLQTLLPAPKKEPDTNL